MKMNKDVTIRLFKNNYIPQLRELVEALQIFEMQFHARRARPRDMIEEAMGKLLEPIRQNSGILYMAFLEEKAVGYISCAVGRDIENAENYVQIGDIYVEEKLRGQGIGTMLLKRAEEYTKSGGYTTIVIGVLAHNRKTYDFYKRYGFKDYSIELVKEIV